MNLLGIFLFLVALTAAYFVNKNIEKIYKALEDNITGKIPSGKYWALSILMLLFVAMLTGTAVGATDGVPVLEYIVPIGTFATAAYLFFIKPTSNRGKKTA